MAEGLGRLEGRLGAIVQAEAQRKMNRASEKCGTALSTPVNMGWYYLDRREKRRAGKNPLKRTENFPNVMKKISLHLQGVNGQQVE